MEPCNDICALNFNEICRLCLLKTDSLSSIFTPPIPTKITSLTAVELYEGDGLPELVCQECSEEVNRMHRFKTLCESSDAALRLCLTTIPFKVETVYPEPELLLKEQDPNVCQERLTKYRSVLRKLDQPCASIDLGLSEEGVTTIYCNVDVDPFEHEEAVITIQRPLCSNEHISLEDLLTQPNTKTTKNTFIRQNQRKPKLPRSIRNDSMSADEPPFNCGTCLKMFSKRDNLKKHEICHTNSKPFLCEECGKKFARKQDLNVHMRYHSGDRPYQCTLCKMRFHSYSGLKGHQNRHYGLKPFLCNVCGKTFAQKSQLTNHERVHTQEKPYTCNLCNSNYTTLTNLKAHQKHHSGMNEFCCSLCFKSFFTRSGLERHELVHTGLKSFACELCELSFFTKSEITRHMRYHNGEKRFPCDICDKSFIENQHLTVHKRIHTGERPFVCDLCKKSFYTKSKLNRHARTHSARAH